MNFARFFVFSCLNIFLSLDYTSAAYRRPVSRGGRRPAPAPQHAPTHQHPQPHAPAFQTLDADLQAALVASMQDFSRPAAAAHAQVGNLPYVNKGLENCVNSCYFNSSLQSLLHLDMFNAYLTSSFDASDSLIAQCYSSLMGKIKGSGVIRCSEKLLPEITLKEFYQNVASTYFPRSVGKQQDAAELLSNLLNTLMRKKADLREELFGIKVMSEIRGVGIRTQTGEYILKCMHGARRVETEIHLPLPIPDQAVPCPLLECLSHYSDYNTIDWRCGECGNVNATISHVLNSLPNNYFIVQLARFTSDRRKIATPILFPLALEFDSHSAILSDELRRDLGRDEQKVRYELVAFIVHGGKDISVGHYWAIGKTPQGEWYKYDDSTVTKIDIQKILNSGMDGAGTPYILFYERQ